MSDIAAVSKVFDDSKKETSYHWVFLMSETVFREDSSDLCAINKTWEQQSGTALQIHFYLI